ncbi:MAG: hypothetical protein HYV75_08160 [Opitutae bacterium]|nr:hypothetical protein [Opitutae bacterium]
MNTIRTWLDEFGGIESVLAHLNAAGLSAAAKQSWRPVSAVAEASDFYEIPF